MCVRLIAPAPAFAAAAPPGGSADCAVPSEVSTATNPKILERKVAGDECVAAAPEGTPVPAEPGAVSSSTATTINMSAPNLIFTAAGMISISSSEVVAQESQMEASYILVANENEAL